MRTANPALNERTFGNFDLTAASPSNVMTLQGTVNKTAILLALLVLAAGFVVHAVSQATDMAAAAMPWIAGGAIIGFILALVTIFVQKAAPFTAPLYALAEGAFLGGLSAVVNAQFPGVAVQAVGCTFGVFAVMLTLYMTRIVQPTRKFMIGVVAATAGICLFYFVEIILNLFGVGTGLLAFNNTSPLSIGISVVVVIIAALNLVLDFGFIESQAQRGAPKYMEWFAGFGLLVTLVWLYLEILRLLAKLQSRD
ncbi:MAG: Bax inhibitor-1/YccA family protein [Phycisphaeraceae bacterium]|nr:Bax inhibitor-1/YccA family protein [Phycisphaeraceae bacterium]